MFTDSSQYQPLNAFIRRRSKLYPPVHRHRAGLDVLLTSSSQAISFGGEMVTLQAGGDNDNKIGKGARSA